VYFTTFSIPKSISRKSEIFCLETLISSHPVIVGCRTYIVLLNRHKLKTILNIIQDNSKFSLLELWETLLLLAPLQCCSLGHICSPPPHYATARTHDERIHDDEVIQKGKTFHIIMIDCINKQFQSVLCYSSRLNHVWTRTINAVQVSSLE
jgi:hypothetical protein